MSYPPVYNCRANETSRSNNGLEPLSPCESFLCVHSLVSIPLSLCFLHSSAHSCCSPSESICVHLWFHSFSAFLSTFRVFRVFRGLLNFTLCALAKSFACFAVPSECGSWKWEHCLAALFTFTHFFVRKYLITHIYPRLNTPRGGTLSDYEPRNNNQSRSIVWLENRA